MTVSGSAARATFARARETMARYHPSDPFLPPWTGPVPVPRRRPVALGETVARTSHPHTVASVAGQLRTGSVSSVELVRAALRAIEARDAELCAFAWLDAEGALGAATVLDAEGARGGWRSPLHGVPITVKDVIDVAGMPTQAACDGYRAAQTRDATAVARLRAAGAVILGKVTTHQFALGVTSPQSRNPHDATRLPGGSSGGSAIAVATGMGLASLGTDTRASIRVPAALSGVVGFKPTFGTIPRDGVVVLSWSMDHLAPMARSVEDAALMLDELVPLSRLARLAAADVKPLDIGVVSAAREGADPEVATAFADALTALRSVHRLSDLEAPMASDFEDANAAGLVISRCEAATVHRSLAIDPAFYWEEVGEQLEEACKTTAVDYLEAQRLRAELAERVSAALREVDLFVLPATLCVAPPAADFAAHLYGLSRNAILWSLVGHPALSVPCGFTAAGLPVGLQLVARPGEENLLVAVGSQFEERLMPLFEQRNRVLVSPLLEAVPHPD